MPTAMPIVAPCPILVDTVLEVTAGEPAVDARAEVVEEGSENEEVDGFGELVLVNVDVVC